MPTGPVTGPPAAARRRTPALSVEDLRGDPTATPDVSVDLVAAAGTITLPSGREVEGFTVNGTSPGPVVEATEGDLVEVRFRNESVADGATLHWHGVDVPNGEDGVAGVTQDAVMPGEEFVYRFVVEDAGHLLVPLPPGLPRAGRQGPARRARRAAARRRRAGRRGGRGHAHLRGPHAQRAGGRGAGRGRARRHRAAAGGQHRQRAGRALGRRALPGARDRRLRPRRADPGRGPGADADRRGAGRPRGHRPRHRCGPGAGRWGDVPGRGTGRGRRTGGAGAAGRRPRPALLRHPRRPAVRRLRGRPALRLRHRAAARLRQRPPRPVVVDQRQALPRRPDVRRRGARRRGLPHRERQRRVPPDAPARPPRGGAEPQRRAGHRQPVVGGLARGRQRRRVRDRLPRRQPGRVDGPLPQPAPRQGGPGRAPDVRRGDDALRDRPATGNTPE